MDAANYGQSIEGPLTMGGPLTVVLALLALGGLFYVFSKL